MREIIREVAGMAPYERRVTELLKVGRDKRALKLCKKKVSAVSHAVGTRSRQLLGHRGATARNLVWLLPLLQIGPHLLLLSACKHP